jgi:RNA polymerase sigma factor (sigma-70 family)
MYQEAVITFMKVMPSFNCLLGTTLSSYIYTCIYRNLIKTYTRQNRLSAISLSTPLNQSDPDSSTLEDIMCRDYDDEIASQIDLNNAIHQLSPSDQRFLYLRYVLERTHAEIAALFFVSQVQISRKETRILAELRIILSNDMQERVSHRNALPDPTKSVSSTRPLSFNQLKKIMSSLLPDLKMDGL